MILFNRIVLKKSRQALYICDLFWYILSYDLEAVFKINFFKKFIGTRQFYKTVLVLMIPIMIQNGITNLVNMVDNIMVGSIGTMQMNGVAVANQLFFVFNLCVFGAVSGAGIFGAQFFGNNDHKGVRHTFRFKIIFSVILTVLGIALFLIFGRDLISLYLKGEGSAEDASASLDYAWQYMLIMLIGLLPYSIVQCYSSTLREGGQPLVPMYAGMAAVFVNLVGNYVLIFGHFGAPRLGIVGAAIATVLSRYVELLVVAVWTARNCEKFPFIIGAFKSLKVPFSLVVGIFKRGLPLMLNEALWAVGIAILNQSYSLRGLDVVSANQISQTFFNVFSTAFMAVGVAIGIILGQLLGSGDIKGAKEQSMKLIAFSVFVSVLVGSAFFVCASFIPNFYNTTDEIRLLATRLMQITAVAMPLDAFAHASYFTLRSGGQAFVTFLFDSCFVWIVSIPVVYVLRRFTTLPILPLYAISQGLNFLKCLIGFYFVKKGIWIKRIVK